MRTMREGRKKKKIKLFKKIKIRRKRYSEFSFKRLFRVEIFEAFLSLCLCWRLVKPRYLRNLVITTMTGITRALWWNGKLFSRMTQGPPVSTKPLASLFSLWKGPFCHWLATVPRHIWNRFLARNFFSTRNADAPRNSSNLLVPDFYRAFLSISFFPPREGKFNSRKKEQDKGRKNFLLSSFLFIWEWIFFKKISTQFREDKLKLDQTNISLFHLPIINNAIEQSFSNNPQTARTSRHLQRKKKREENKIKKPREKTVETADREG